MQQHISLVALVVAEYQDGIDFFVDKLNFTLVENRKVNETKSWVVVSPPGNAVNGVNILLARAANDAQRAAIGNQTGGRCFLFLNTDDFKRDHAQMLAKGVNFLEEPRDEPSHMVAQFEDPFGNTWDLLENKNV